MTYFSSYKSTPEDCLSFFSFDSQQLLKIESVKLQVDEMLLKLIVVSRATLN